jgi:glyoxylase-like metal-dependent hydrolase (beta-lactamase superfamily II)
MMEVMMDTRVIKRVEDIDPATIAWVKQLRENNKTKKIYDIDPYVEIYQFRENIYGLFTESADGMGDPWQFVIIGPERAMLIDTGFGIGDLKGLVEKITGSMPLIVVNTHKSFDHSFGNFQFDKVHCHEYQVPYMKMQMNPRIWDYLFDENDNGIWMNFDRKDIVSFKEFEPIGCQDGQIFNLGGDYEIELIHMPGHQAGHCAFLDKKSRILFSGDNILSFYASIGTIKPNPNIPYGEYATVSALHYSVERVARRLDEFDYLLPSHHILDVESRVVLNVLKALNEIVEDPARNFDYTFEKRGRLFKYKCVKGFGGLAYTD